MSEPPKFTLHAYAVTLVFGPDGPIHMGTTFMPSVAEAVASVTFNVMRKAPPTQDLTGVACIELPTEWLRAALQAVETGKPAGTVLSLVARDGEVEQAGGDPGDEGTPAA